MSRRRVITRANAREQIRLTTAKSNWVTADTVIDASGYEAARALGRKAGIHLRNTYAVISEPVSEDRLWYQRWLIWETRRPYLYLRTTGDNRVTVGRLDTGSPIRSGGTRASREGRPGWSGN